MSARLRRKEFSKKGSDRKAFCNCTKDTCDHKSISIEEKPLLVFCGQGGQAQFSSPDDPPVNLASVTVDGEGLNKPLVGIKFSSIVSLTTPDGDNPQALLTFRLFRACNDGASIPLNSWVYEVFNINDRSFPLRFITSFAFVFCDRSNNGRLCDYFVEVSINNLNNATVLVDNIQIQAIAQ